jgi:uncharacterized membrane protein
MTDTEITERAAITAPGGLFEMRRLESLSNTIFGVAMTLLAYDLPKNIQFTAVPGWSELYHQFGGRLAGVILSFVVAGLFWISHHRRLTRQPLGSRGVVILNLFFLLSIILLPVTTGLYSSFRQSSAIAVLYGLQLTVVAALNAVLWRLAIKGWRAEIAAAIFPVLVFVPGTLVAWWAPQYAQYVWFLAFGGLLVRRLASRQPEA